MKYFLSVFLFFLLHQAFGQNVDSVSKIILIYGKSHNSWGDPGIYGKSERIEIQPINKRSFKITKHVAFTSTAGNDGNTFSTDSTIIGTGPYPLISKAKIKDLLFELNNNKDNFNAGFIIRYLKKPQTRIIDSISNSQGDSLFFDKDFLSERRSGLKKIRSFNKLDSFLYNKKPDPKMHLVVTDGANHLKILIIGRGMTEYTSELYNLFGQPFFKEAEKNSMANETGVVNLKINTAIFAMLPKSSFLRQNIDLNRITQDYLSWYLEKDLWRK